MPNPGASLPIKLDLEKLKELAEMDINQSDQENRMSANQREEEKNLEALKVEPSEDSEDLSDLSSALGSSCDESDISDLQYNRASSFIENLRFQLDTRTITELEEILNEYKRTTKRLRNCRGTLETEISDLENSNKELRCSLVKSEAHNYRLETEKRVFTIKFTNLICQLQRGFEDHCKAKAEELRAKEEEKQLEVQEREKAEFKLREVQLENTTLVNNLKQLQEEYKQVQTLLADEVSARTGTEKQLNICLQRQQETEKRMRQQIATLAAQLQPLRKDLQSLQKTFTEAMSDTRQYLEKAHASYRTLDFELESTRARLAADEKEAERFRAAHSEAEWTLLQEKGECQRLIAKHTAEVANLCEEKNSLSQKLVVAEANADHMEHKVTQELKASCTIKTYLNKMQQELSDSLHKLSVSEASLERNKHHLNVLQEDKAVLVKDVATLKEQLCAERKRTKELMKQQASGTQLPQELMRKEESKEVLRLHTSLEATKSKSPEHERGGPDLGSLAEILNKTILNRQDSHENEVTLHRLQTARKDLHEELSLLKCRHSMFEDKTLDLSHKMEVFLKEHRHRKFACDVGCSRDRALPHPVTPR